MTVIRSSVSRRTDRDPNSALRLARQRQIERDTAAHQAALRVIDLIDATRRTDPGPQATRIEAITQGVQSPAPDLRTPVYVDRDLEPAHVRQIVSAHDRAVMIGLSLIAAILLGLAMGRLL